LTDGGIETFLIFHRGAELPYFATYVLLEDDAGTRELRNYSDDYLKIASDFGTGFILESVTWRANPEWAKVIGTSPEDLEALNRKAIDLLVGIREQYKTDVAPIVISGNIGPRSDGYRPTEIMTEQEAEQYHAKSDRHHSGGSRSGATRGDLLYRGD
jgi:homocysteine S-methyltransferase